MRKRLFISLLFLCALLLSACAAQRAAPEASAPQETDTQAVSELDAFYQHPLAAAYGDVRKLDADYTAEQAQRDRCFVIGVTVHNDDLYTAFMANVEQRKDAFIRVVTECPEAVLTPETPIRKGARVQVIRGSLKGVEGEVVENPSGVSLVVRILSILSAKVSIPREDLALL